MKHTTIIRGSIIGGTIISSSCITIDGESISSSEGSTLVNPTGVRGSKIQDIVPWEDIKMSGAFQADVTLGALPASPTPKPLTGSPSDPFRTPAPEDLPAQGSQVVITADTAILPFLEVRVKNRTLEFRFTQSLHIVGKMETPHFGVYTKGPLRFADLSGACKLNIQGLQQETLKIDVSGSAQLQLRGKVNHLKLEVSGAGVVHAQGLAVEKTSLDMSGASSAYLNTHTAKGEMSGASNLTLPPSALSSIQTSGASSVRR